MKTNPNPILNRLIQFSALNPWFILIVMAVMAIGGWQAIQRAALDAIPDLSEPQVIVLSSGLDRAQT